MVDPRIEDIVGVIVERHRAGEDGGRGALISVLQGVQKEFGYLPERALDLIARELKLPPSRVYGVATFYAQFYLTPRGRHTIRICQGTACHVKGGKGILEAVERELDLEPGRTTEDLEFTLEIVRCIGCCSLAPVMVLDGKAFGQLTRERALRILRRYYGQDQGPGGA